MKPHTSLYGTMPEAYPTCATFGSFVDYGFTPCDPRPDPFAFIFGVASDDGGCCQEPMYPITLRALWLSIH